MASATIQTAFKFQVLNYAALPSKYFKSMIMENNLLLSILMHQNNMNTVRKYFLWNDSEVMINYN